MATTKTQANYFVELAKINVNEHIERKGPITLHSWHGLRLVSDASSNPAAHCLCGFASRYQSP